MPAYLPACLPNHLPARLPAHMPKYILFTQRAKLKKKHACHHARLPFKCTPLSPPTSQLTTFLIVEFQTNSVIYRYAYTLGSFVCN